MFVYSLFNKKVPYWNPPTFADTVADVTGRNLRRYCLSNEEAARKAHYDECDLYCFGEFDDNKGKFVLYDSPEFVCSLADCFPAIVPPEPAKFSSNDIQQLAFTLKALLMQEENAHA